MSDKARQALRRKFIVVATMALLVTLMALGFGKVFLEDIKALEGQRIERTQEVHERQWDFIEAIINENLMRAEGEAEVMKEFIKAEIESQYGDDMEALEYDLCNPSTDSRITKIFQKATDGVYLNIDNDNNDPFILVSAGTKYKDGIEVPDGYVAHDRSFNGAATKGDARLLEDNPLIHANPDVAAELLLTIVNNDTTSKNLNDRVWQFLEPTTDDYLLTGSSLADVKALYDKYGLAPLSSLEFMHNEYIEEEVGVFGIPDVDGTGHKNKNVKIIVAQGFNPHEALMTHHKTVLYGFQRDVQAIDKEINKEIHQKRLVITLLIIMYLIVVVAIIAIQNSLADILELERRKG